MADKYCDNGKDHAHIVTKGSMQLAHNLDDRAERAKLSTDDEIDVLEAKRAAEQVQAQVKSRFKNLDWLSNRGK